MLINDSKIMRIIVAVVLLSGLCSVAQAKLAVVATTPALASVADAVGGSHANVKALSLATQDPHRVDARPDLALELARADLLVLVGLNLGYWYAWALLTPVVLFMARRFPFDRERWWRSLPAHLLADIAASDQTGFRALVDRARTSLAQVQ